MARCPKQVKFIEDRHVLNRRDRLNDKSSLFEERSELLASQITLVKGLAQVLSTLTRLAVSQPVGEAGLQIVGAEGGADAPPSAEHAPALGNCLIQPLLEVVIETKGEQIAIRAVGETQRCDIADLDLQRWVNLAQLVDCHLDEIKTSNVVATLMVVTQDAPGTATGLEYKAVVGSHRLQGILQGIDLTIGHRTIGRDIDPTIRPVILDALGSEGGSHEISRSSQWSARRGYHQGWPGV